MSPATQEAVRLDQNEAFHLSAGGDGDCLDRGDGPADLLRLEADLFRAESPFELHEDERRDDHLYGAFRAQMEDRSHVAFGAQSRRDQDVGVQNDPQGV